MIKIKSVYAKALKEDGKRIFVDLFWPEGIKTHEAHVDAWLHELAPTYDLQRFHFNLSNWEDYKTKYTAELLSSPHKKNLLEELANNSRNGTLTLLYGNRHPSQNHAHILKELIENNYLTGEEK
ncbi:MAG: DUF488 domain-containing protein [bacterium]